MAATANVALATSPEGGDNHAVPDTALAKTRPRHGALGRVLHVDLGERRSWVEDVEEQRTQPSAVAAE